MGDSEQLRSGFFGQIGQICGVSVRNYQDVTGIDGLNIHEDRAAVVAVDDAGRQFAGKNVAEYAIVHHTWSHGR